jgi:thiamine biosynthesis lipoprotein
MAEPTRTGRRGFLRGQSAAEALADAVVGPPPELPLPQGLRPAERQLLSVSREAMACMFEVVFDAAQYRSLSEVAMEALELVSRLEDQLTVYRDTSEVAQINRQSADEPVPAEAGLFDLLQRAVELSAETGGAFDITAGGLAKVWGFHRRQGRMPAPDEVAAALALVGWRNLALDPPTRTIRFLQRGMELNLGAIGKGYALDRAADALLAGGLSDFLIHGGNSSVLARGSRTADCGLRIPGQLIQFNPQSAIRNPKLVGPSPSAIRSARTSALQSLRFAIRPSARAARGRSSFIIRASATDTSSTRAPAGRQTRCFLPP